MSDPLRQISGMTTNHHFNFRVESSPIRLPRRRRVPRGLILLRALRLRLATEDRPQFYQAEFQFGK
jgi:hypothetical protein